ncbi:hypothetical protein [Photobacterium kishitanii]|uniref:Uncharacterized protein n=1 Tax=Photobacterium kishitanii TaxID=318456 RepID=A0A2T3KKW3_9GAMM|nr:hypothetical protein [Photobacterium kishitanii]PSV00306.1 hypothetical protein C9J27_04060 [Photobacterium kishitanii]
MTTPANAIQLKIASLKIKESTFINPILLENSTVLSCFFNAEAYHSFNLGSVVYFISQFKTPQYIGDNGFYTICVLDGNVIHKSDVSLQAWEWLYLVHGEDRVNALEYFRFSFSTREEYITAKQLSEDILHWKIKAKDDPQHEGMDAYIRKSATPVTLLSDCTWVNRV